LSFSSSSSHKSRLIQCKGKRKVRARVVELSTQSLNHGDVFVLDVGKRIYVWNGAKSNIPKRTKGISVANTIKTQERRGPTQIILLEKDTDPYSDEFWEEIKGRKEDVAELGGDDQDVERAWLVDVKLYKVCGIETSLELKEEGQGPLIPEMLDPASVFVMDSPLELYIWRGKTATDNHFAFAESKANQILETSGRSKTVSPVLLNQGSETLLFTEKFVEWSDSAIGRTKPVPGGSLSNSTSNITLTNNSKPVNNPKQDNASPAAGEDGESNMSRSGTVLQTATGNAFDSIGAAAGSSFPFPVTLRRTGLTNQMPKVQTSTLAGSSPSSNQHNNSHVSTNARTSSFTSPNTSTTVHSSASVEQGDATQTYTLDQLQQLLKTGFPNHLDLAKIENYLADSEFVDVFKMDRKAFYQLPIWKRNQKKKLVGLF
jgi:hypothetical protein